MPASSLSDQMQDSIANAKIYSALEKNDYSSKGLNAYYDSLHSTPGFGDFKIISKNEAKKVPFSFVKIINVAHPVKYNDNQYFSLYYDSIMDLNEIKMRSNYNLRDSLERKIKKEKIGVISRMYIVKEARFSNKWAVIYTDYQYDDTFNYGAGYWIALSNDKGKSWKKYYTGLTQRCHFDFKRNSAIPLWKDSITLQIECVINRQISRAALPVMPPKFEVVQDGIAVQLDLTSITKDSDNDGLTDIVEDKMMLNPNNRDTDGDGIVDSKDNNPRFKSIRFKSSVVYEAILNGASSDKYGFVNIDTIHPIKDKESTRKLEYRIENRINLFVTDDPVIQHLSTLGEKTIIMSHKEYNIYKKKYPSHFDGVGCTQLFKCDKWSNTYVLISYHHTGSAKYLVMKTNRGWKMIMLSMSIS